jgi:hypothetical protein
VNERVTKRHPGGSAGAAMARSSQRSHGGTAVLALQRRIGNAAVGRILARDDTTKTQPAPATKQWQNPQLVKDIYPGREEMLRKFVAMYREIEAQAMTDETARKTAMAGVKTVDALTGDTLTAEVERLFNAGVAPAWLKDMVIDYSGMRYKSAHGSYFNPRSLVLLVKRESGEIAKSRTDQEAAEKEAYDKAVQAWEAAGKKPKDKPAKPKPVKVTKVEADWKAKSVEQAEDFLAAEHAAGRIPEWAWHKIVRVTNLKTRLVTGPGWEDESREKPDPSDKTWVKIMKEWTADSTAWRGEIQRRDELVTSRMVCNELSEAAQRKRGVILAGGISKNAEQFRKDGKFFKHPAGKDDFLPGGAIFWINTDTWETSEPDDSNKVRYIDGETYPMPTPPEYIASWKAWAASKEGKQQLADKKKYQAEHAAWERATAAKKKNPKAKDPGDEPKAPTGSTEPQKFWTDLLPAKSGVHSDGWTYTLEAGKPITREKEIDGKVVKHWMRWLHQATVLKAMPDGRVFILETTNTTTSPDHAGVSGFNVRTVASLSKPSVFVGYIPTKDEAAAGAKAEPASLPASGPTAPNFTPAPWAPPPGVPLWPFPVGVPGPYPNSSPAPWVPQ